MAQSLWIYGAPPMPEENLKPSWTTWAVHPATRSPEVFRWLAGCPVETRRLVGRLGWGHEYMGTGTTKRADPTKQLGVLQFVVFQMYSWEFFLFHSTHAHKSNLPCSWAKTANLV